MVLVAVVAVAAGSAVGQPVGLGYVTGDSMEPTLERGDGFVAVPAPLADVTEGDVAVYENDVGLTTHRVVEVTEEGYVTRGDANPFTDQRDGDAVITDDEIVATALRVGGGVVVVPGLGSVSERVEAFFGYITGGVTPSDGTPVLAHVFLVVSIVGYLYETARRRTGRNDGSGNGEGLRPRMLRVAAVVAVVVAVVGGTMVPSGTQTLDTVSAEFGSDSPLVVEPGGTASVGYEVSNTGFLPVVVHVGSDSDRVTVGQEYVTVEGGGTTEVAVDVQSPDETGYHPVTVTERRYLALVPASTIELLHRMHPFLPRVVTVLLVGGGVYVAGRLILPDGVDSRSGRRRGERGWKR